jgi:hypothetical protein
MKLPTIFLAFVATGSVLATPSGLNNIPTADTTPQGTAVFQSFSTFGNDRDTDLNFGFKSGLDLGPADFEFGTSAYLAPDKSGPWTVHGNCVLEAWGNFPDNGDEASLTVKANIVLTF